MTTETKTTLANRPVKEIYAVSRLVREARGVLEGAFPLLWVEGEISNLAMPASGHIYFTLKDEAAQVRCAMFRMRNRQLRFTPENGMQVLLRVRLTIYEGRGDFQCIVEHMEEAGSGALQRAFEALKQRLGEEGLFEQRYKKTLPTYPATIGIVSSPDGAAVHDILTVLKRRFPAIPVILFPVAVQGAGSAQQIATAIRLAEQHGECDVLIVGRGGGSLEDLWSFNDEQLARTIFSCTIPIISAVGHEIDFTIADFVADVRAPTPSAAAEIVVPDRNELQSQIRQLLKQLTIRMGHKMEQERRHLVYLQQRLSDPRQRIVQQLQRIDLLEQRMHRNWTHLIRTKRQQLKYTSARLKHPQDKIEAQRVRTRHVTEKLAGCMRQQQRARNDALNTLQQRLFAIEPQQLIEQGYQRLDADTKRLNHAMAQLLHFRHEKLHAQMRTLTAVSPLNTLERGYSITQDARTGTVITDAAAVTPGQALRIRLHRGHIQCEVTDHDQ